MCQSWPACLLIPCVRFPVLVNHAKWNTFVIDVESQWQGILTDIVHVSSGETYSFSWSNTFLVWESYTRKQLSAAILHLGCNDIRFSGLRILPTGKSRQVLDRSTYYIIDRSMLLSRFRTRFLYQYGISGCKLQIQNGSQTGLYCWEAVKVMKSNMSRTLLLLVSTLVFVFVSRTVGAKSDVEVRLFKLAGNGIDPNKIYTRSLCYGSLELF